MTAIIIASHLTAFALGMCFVGWRSFWDESNGRGA